MRLMSEQMDEEDDAQVEVTLDDEDNEAICGEGRRGVPRRTTRRRLTPKTESDGSEWAGEEDDVDESVDENETDD